MYIIVICPDCETPRIVKDDPETIECFNCGKRHQQRKLRIFCKTDNAAEARRVKGQIVAEQRGLDDVFDELGAIDVEASTQRVNDVFMQQTGLADALREDATASRKSSSPVALIKQAIRDTSEPTEDRILAVVAEHGMDAKKAQRTLSKLFQQGEITEQNGEYRVL
jgi:predicted Rossmann fold nucleotide-binding protein DprA/Smf involved in DNA uptake